MTGTPALAKPAVFFTARQSAMMAFRYNGRVLWFRCALSGSEAQCPLQAPAKPHTFDSSRYHGLTRERLIRMYRTMFMSRRLDDREVQLKRQHKIYFQISGAGHEAVLAAAGEVLRPGYDWFFPYYRDRALCLRLGVTPYEMLLQSVGAKDDPASGGRQMPSHWGQARLNVVARSSTAGMQWLQAAGAAEASLYYEAVPQALEQARQAPLGEHVRHYADEIVFVSGGEGMTSEGEFFEALNTASLKTLPVLFLIEDNGWAISVPAEVQTAGGSISRLLTNFPGPADCGMRRNRSAGKLRCFTARCELLPGT